MQGLILHTGGSTVGWRDVVGVATPPATESHFPIPHHELVSIARDVLQDRGWPIVSEAHALARGGSNYFGLFEVDRPEFDGGMTRTVVGLRNSHIFQYAAAIALGGRVVVCDNLLFTGEVVLGRRHTRNILRDIYPLVSLAVAKLDQSKVIERERFVAYQAMDVSRKCSDHILMSALRSGVIPPSKMAAIVQDFDFPGWRHLEFEQYKGSVFGLYMAITEHTKGSLWLAPKRCEKLHGILDAAALYRSASLDVADVVDDVEDVEWKEAA